MIILKGVTITVTDNALTPMTGTSIRTDNNHDIEKIAKIEEILTRKNTIDRKFDKTMNGAIELHLQTDSITEIGYHLITPQIEIMAITNQESTELKIERTMITVITGIDTIATTDIMTEKMIIDDRILHLIPIDHQIGTDMTVLIETKIKCDQIIRITTPLTEIEPQALIGSLGQIEIIEIIRIIEEMLAKIKRNNQRSNF